jgi:hypothetical protein
MRNEANEYSIAELLDHPGLGWVITSGGIEHRCLDLMLDARSRDRRYADAEARVVIFDQRISE